ncbi:hypothetical protein JOF42_003469 [Microbacterium phyllosphaerae]|uniref:DUF2264 domain-containing protein n=1 Tax=Microbacterium phyllosphaerae TaxID=124798 RepID=A0ABS4WWW8_9MICO|nr:DUF2264 domain-containing protein [Microbacterium phyllosphaerae]MBP2379974.1 hypothetical protein [Microbacterium phyllosphaerae]
MTYERTVAPTAMSPREGHASPDAEWSRDDLLAYADGLLAAVRPWASENGARITLPGASGGYGIDVDGLEGFVRTFLLAGFRIAGARGEGVDDLIDFYSRGIVAGVDPSSPDRWVRLDEHAQAKVEAASIALILDMTRPWIWDRLDETTQHRMIDYLAPVVGDDSYPKNNWLWFRVVVQTFLRSVGGPWSQADIAQDLAQHDSFVREGGWISDGDDRAYDHYVGWALHLYPVLWSRMQGAGELAGGRTEGDLARLDTFLQDAIALVGADGSPLIQGRSLVYRFAAAAPYWAGAIAQVPSVPLGQLRRAASDIVRHFAENGAPNDQGLLDLGWHGEWRRLAQNYSGTGSPYWASKGLLGVALPADHPVWSAPAEPLPIETVDVLRAVQAPAWIISATADDGIVRVINHGADHARPGDLVGDSPLYARLGYSTAASPLLNGDAWAEPLEQSVALLHADGRATHRAGMRVQGIRRDGDAAIAGSEATAHWIAPDATQTRHGSGITGEVEVAGTVTTWSIVRGAWEVRLVRIDRIEADAAPTALRIGGWALAADAVDDTLSATAASASARGRHSTIAAVTPGGVPSIEARRDASPLGAAASVPVITYPVLTGEWIATAVHLSDRAAASAPSARIDGDDVAVVWPDSTTTEHRLA